MSCRPDANLHFCAPAAPQAKRKRLVSTLAAAVALLVVSLGRHAARAAEVGDVAAADAFAPEELWVVDAETTVSIAMKAGKLLPVVVVHDPAIADEVVTSFNDAFVRTQAAFLDRLSAKFGVVPLSATAVEEDAFRSFRAEFQNANALFPVSQSLGQSWARGDTGELVRERISVYLRLVQRDYWIGAVRPATTVFVVPRSRLGPVRSWGEVFGSARAVGREDVYSLSGAGQQLRRWNDPLDRPAAGFLSGLLRANIAEDHYLTGLLLRDRLGSAATHRRYAAGEKIAGAGQRLDRWAMLALNQLERMGLPPDQGRPLHDEQPAPIAAVAPNVAPELEEPGRWLPILAGVTVALFISGSIVLVVLFRRWRRHSTALIAAVPTHASGLAEPGPSTELSAPTGLKDRLIRALFTQRSVLLANEEAASQRVHEMEERLARLQPAIAEKIRGYERRIAALEKEVAERDADTRELIRAKLVLARKELDAEITRNRIDWN